MPDSIEAARKFVLISTAVIGVAIVIISFVLLVSSAAFNHRQQAFTVIVTQTLLPLFNTLATAVVAFILAKAVVEVMSTRKRD